MTSVLDNNIVIILVSLIWGIGLAILFRRICQGDNCVIVNAPQSLVGQNNIIRDNNKCYQLEKYDSPCSY